MHYKLALLEDSHFAECKVRDEDIAAKQQLKEYHDLHPEQFHCYSFIEEGLVLGIGGVVVGENGYAEAFIIMSNSCIKKKTRFSLLVKRKIKEISERCSLKTIDAYIDNRFLLTRVRWIQLMGFTKNIGACRFNPSWQVYRMVIQ